MIEKILKKAVELSPEHLKESVACAIKAVFHAGMAIRDLYGRPHDIEYKGKIDLVTEADYKSEEILTKSLKGVGQATILAEESSEDLRPKDGYMWIIDPLDGTTNFAHGFPFFAPSVAYSKYHKDKLTTEFGCIFIPILNEFFWAIKGCGAFLNLEKINVSNVRELKKALLATGFPYDVYKKPDAVISALKSMITKAQGIRRAGAAAIDLAYVACGRFDGFWEKKLKPWDTAAGQLLVEEAGGIVTDYSNDKYDPFVPEICASNGFVHQEMIAILKEYSWQHTNL